jgi:hypothetical protein
MVNCTLDKPWLAGCKNLIELDLRNVVMSESLDLPKFPSLTGLTLDSVALESFRCSEFGAGSRKKLRVQSDLLKGLTLHDIQAKDLPMISCPQLLSLELVSCRIDKSFNTYGSKLRALQALVFTGCFFSEVTLRACRHVRSLSIRNMNGIAQQPLDFVSSLPSLQSLTVSEVSASFDTLTLPPTLTELSLRQRDKSDGHSPDLSVLLGSQFPSLTSLSVEYMNAEHVRGLAKACPNLHSLEYNNREFPLQDRADTQAAVDWLRQRCPTLQRARVRSDY